MSGLIALAVVLGVAVLFAVLRGHRRGRPRALRPQPEQVAADLNLTSADATELAAIGRQLEAEFDSGRRLVLYHVECLDARRVPLRAIRPGSTSGVGRLCFADGTVIQVRSRRMGDLGLLAVRAQRGRLWLAGYRSAPEGVVMDIGWPQGGLSVVAVGLDQSD